MRSPKEPAVKKLSPWVPGGLGTRLRQPRAAAVRSQRVEGVRPGLFDAEGNGVGKKFFEMLRRRCRSAGHVHPLLFGERQILAKAVDAVHHLRPERRRCAHQVKEQEIDENDAADADQKR